MNGNLGSDENSMLDDEDIELLLGDGSKNGEKIEIQSYMESELLGINASREEGSSAEDSEGGLLNEQSEITTTVEESNDCGTSSDERLGPSCIATDETQRQQQDTDTVNSNNSCAIEDKMDVDDLERREEYELLGTPDVVGDTPRMETENEDTEVVVAEVVNSICEDVCLMQSLDEECGSVASSSNVYSSKASSSNQNTNFDIDMSFAADLNFPSAPETIDDGDIEEVIEVSDDEDIQPCDVEIIATESEKSKSRVFQQCVRLNVKAFLNKYHGEHMRISDTAATAISECSKVSNHCDKLRDQLKGCIEKIDKQQQIIREQTVVIQQMQKPIVPVYAQAPAPVCPPTIPVRTTDCKNCCICNIMTSSFHALPINFNERRAFCSNMLSELDSHLLNKVMSSSRPYVCLSHFKQTLSPSKRTNNNNVASPMRSSTNSTSGRSDDVVLSMANSNVVSSSSSRIQIAIPPVTPRLPNVVHNSFDSVDPMDYPPGLRKVYRRFGGNIVTIKIFTLFSDFVLSRKINGEIIYPRPQQTPVVEMVRLYYYVESLHGQWLSSETVLCRKEGSTKFAIQFEKADSQRLVIGDRVVMFAYVFQSPECKFVSNRTPYYFKA